MKNKERWRKVDSQKMKKRKNERKKKEHEREIRSVSRKKRNYIRRQIRPYYERFRSLADKHLMIVLKDNENMEKIFLQKHSIGEDMTLFALPTINLEMIDAYLNVFNTTSLSSTSEIIDNDDARIINDIIEFYYGVTSNDITTVNGLNMIVLRECTVVEKKEDLEQVIVRPYNPITWYKGEATTLNGYKVHSSNNLKHFFDLDTNLGKSFVFQDTLTEIILYKAMRKKIDFKSALRDNTILAKKKTLDTRDLYLLCTVEEKDIYNRFKNEKKEYKELDCDDGR